eukprot:192838-Chlamydomonas_euryale.AAC.1
MVGTFFLERGWHSSTGVGKMWPGEAETDGEAERAAVKAPPPTHTTLTQPWTPTHKRLVRVGARYADDALKLFEMSSFAGSNSLRCRALQGQIV